MSQGRDAADDQDVFRAVSSARVLADEYALIWPDRPQPGGGDEKGRVEDYYRKAFDNGQAALCLSGGGIRSAAFALGVLQGLSRKKLLTGFHYLSTVSGGGYIGAWLERWIAEPDTDATGVMNALGGRVEPEQVTGLRAEANFITPRTGLGSNDTWTALAISVRNIAINWLLFGPLFLLTVLVPNIFASGLEQFPRDMGISWLHLLYYGEVAVVGLLTAYACLHVSRALPSYGHEGAADGHAAEKWVRWRIVFPLLAAAALGSFVLACDLFWAPHLSLAGIYLQGTLLAAAIAAGMLVGLVLGSLSLPGPGRRIFLRDLPFWGCAALGAAATIQLGALALAAKLWVPAPEVPPPLAAPPAAVKAASTAATPGHPAAAAPVRPAKVIAPEDSREVASALHWRAAMLALLGPILLLWAQVSAISVFAAFRSGSSPGIQPDADREWLARLTALEMKPVVAWALIATSSLLLFDLLQEWVPGFDLSMPGIVALVSAAGAVAGGRSDRSGLLAGAGGRVLRILPLQGLIALATFVFGVALLMFLARVEENVAATLGKFVKGLMRLPAWLSEEGAGHYAMAVTLVLLLALFSRAVRVNRFSLNGFYRNRLSRAFLGAARSDRAPQPFTGFDPRDNIRMHILTPAAGGRHVLYPVINVALNVTASDKLAWQERKAEPFIFSPLYSGSAMLPQEEDPSEVRNGAYVSSNIYGGNEPDFGMEGMGVSLATAMAISGAAASPNMGYHSSPATAFLMTLFNVRLGAWMPNPGRCATLKQDIARADPKNSLSALLHELGGMSDDRGRDVYLSDGGHFENLGLYEMIRRRCRYIVLSDAAADPDCRFEALGNAVRKIKIDLGIDICFEELRISSRARPIHPQYAWALGEILYPEGKGHLLYIKPSLFGDLPVDVHSYAEASAAFPHETTGDQFFSESQFESYRRLGDFFADELGKNDEQGNRVDAYPDVAAFFEAVEGEHRREKAGDEEKQTRSLLKRVISSLGFAPHAQG